MFLESSNLVEVDVESVCAKCLMLNLIKLITQGLIFLPGGDYMKGWKQHRVLACHVRLVHADEGSEILGKPLAIAWSPQRLESREDPIGELSSRGVLLV